MAMYLKITDGTTTIDLLGNDATNSFNLLAGAWAPNVARRKQGKLSGQWAEDVVESMPLYVQSDTDAATILANLDTLAALLDQAQRWNDGESVAAVTIRYSPNSDTDYLETVILGPSGNGVELPPTFSDDLYQNAVDGVRLNFKRRGEWLGAEESDTASAITPGNIAGIDFGTSLKRYPVEIEMTASYGAGAVESWSGFILAMNYDGTNSNIQLDNCKASADADGINTAATPIGVHARSGASAIAATSGSSGYITWEITETALINSTHLYELFVVFGSSGANNFQWWYEILRDVDGEKPVIATSKKVSVIGSGSLIQAVSIGLLSTNIYATDATHIRLNYTRSSASGTQYLDYYALINREQLAGIVGLYDQANMAPDTYSILHNLLSDKGPVVLGDTTISLPYAGVANFQARSTAEMEILPMVSGGFSDLTWRYTDNISTVDTIAITVTRRPAYLVPR